MRKLDLDQPVTKAFSSNAPDCVVVQWNYDGEERTTFFYTKQTLEFGRESTCDVCLRVEPVEVGANRDATLKISRRHFRVSVGGDVVQVVDLGSACGTSVGSVTLEPNKPFDLRDGELLTVADCLKLLVRIEKENDKILSVRFRRVSNLSSTEYICLVERGTIDIGETSLLRLALTSARRGHTRTLDIGQDHNIGTPATIFVMDGGIHIKRTGNDTVIANQTELAPDQSVPFSTEGIIQVGNSHFNIITPP